MIIVDYTESLPPMRGTSIRYKAEHLWNGNVTFCDYVRARDKEILEAYAQHGIPSWDNKDESVKPIVTGSDEDVPVVELVQVPEDWMDLSWIEKRVMATNINKQNDVTDPIKNKAHAESVIQAYVDSQSVEEESSEESGEGEE